MNAHIAVAELTGADQVGNVDIFGHDKQVVGTCAEKCLLIRDVDGQRWRQRSSRPVDVRGFGQDLVVAQQHARRLDPGPGHVQALIRCRVRNVDRSTECQTTHVQYDQAIVPLRDEEHAIAEERVVHE